MNKLTLSAVTAAGMLAVSAANAEQGHQVAAEFPSGTFLENLTVLPDDTTVFTSYFARQLGQLTVDNATEIFANLPAHPVGILATADGFVVTAHGSPFTEGPEFTQTQQILMLNLQGEVTQTIDVPDALFLNGLEHMETGQVLIADSIAGTIWSLDLVSGQVVSWLQHEMLTQNPDLPVFAPGANGIKQDGNRLLVSNSGRGAIFEIALDDAGEAASEPQLFAQTGAVDDFYVDGGRILFTTHGDALQAIETDGTISTLISEGCDGCTSVAKRGEDYLVLTTGGLLEGHTEPARILQIPAN
ncbi:MAG: hypothetical protein AAF414_05020 [Pseudomonadota bacterium]